MSTSAVSMSAESRRKRRRSQPKGRQVDLQALAEIRELLGDRPRRQDLVLEYLHLIQDRYGHLSAPHIVGLAAELQLPRAHVFEVATFYHHMDVVKEGDAAPPALTIRVCDSLTCAMKGAEALAAALESGTDPKKVRVQRVSCVGRCAEAPVAIVGQRPVEAATVDTVRKLADGNEHGPEKDLDPIAYSDYRRDGGYKLYAECMSGNRDVESIIKTLEDASLRGLGGAGFPAGRKWRILRDQPKPRYLVVNIDEGEPGTFKDRYFMERDPHRCLEGILIAAWATEIDEVYLYIRDEYPACRALMAQAITELEADPPAQLPKLIMRRGAGAYICGEESSLIESIEGKRGLPRLRPPYVAQVGLFERPTLEQNLETLYWVREIVERGPEWFAGQGRNGRKGLRSFSVSGRVKKPGVHIAPAGITLRELIDEYCGGMEEGHELYGYFPGGASGGILPASLADVPLDFDTLQPHGCFIGSAAIVVFSQHDKARDLARNVMRFFAHESCGQCTPCRVGTQKAAALMAEEKWDHALLEDLSTVMADASICGLGQAAPNPIRCVAKYFPEEVN